VPQAQRAHACQGVRRQRVAQRVVRGPGRRSAERRLLVALDDAERATGANSSTTRTLARLVRERLARESAAESLPRQEEERHAS
jgi:hypothetical protein